MKIGDIVSRMRSVLNSNRINAFVTDRYLYSVFFKYAQVATAKYYKDDSILENNYIFKTQEFDLKDVDTTDQSSFRTGCKIKRTFDKLPEILFLRNSFIIKQISSIDGSQTISIITRAQYYNMTQLSSFKYNKDHYGWIENNYLYLADVDWDMVQITAAFLDEAGEDGICSDKKDSNIYFPEEIIAESEQLALKEIATYNSTMSVTQTFNLKEDAGSAKV